MTGEARGGRNPGKYPPDLTVFSTSLHFPVSFEFRAIPTRETDPVLFDRLFKTPLVMRAVKVSVSVDIAVSEFFV